VIGFVPRINVEILRKLGAAALGIVLLLYIVGSLRLVAGLLRGQATGQPLWAIIGGLYIRFMIMAFFCFLIFALVGGQQARK
jgi:hypothetical protein